MSYVFTKYWCQIILIYSYFKTGSKPNKCVHKSYENCSQLTLYFLVGKKKKKNIAHFTLSMQNYNSLFVGQVLNLSNRRHNFFFTFVHGRA